MLMFGNKYKYDLSFSGQSSGSEYYQAYVCSGLMKRGQYVLTFVMSSTEFVHFIYSTAHYDVFCIFHFKGKKTLS